MSKMLVVVFDDEAKAYEGSRALTQLHRDGSISAYAGAVVARDAAGKVTVKDEADEGPAGTAVGMLTGALIEARSCERFAALVPVLPERIGRFYAGLLASEARHFENYLAFARRECDVGDTEFDQRRQELQALEASLIADPDPEFRFHSGRPA